MKRREFITLLGANSVARNARGSTGASRAFIAFLRRAATPLARSTGAIQKVPILRASKLASESFEAPAIPPSSIGSVPMTIR